MNNLLTNGGLVLIIFILQIIADAFSDSFRYKYDKFKDVKYLKYVHSFELLQVLTIDLFNFSWCKTFSK